MAKTSGACQKISMVAINGSEHETAAMEVTTEMPEQERGATEATKIEASKQEMVVLEMAKVGATKGNDSSEGNSVSPSLGLPWNTGLRLFVLNLRYFNLLFPFFFGKNDFKNIFGMSEDHQESEDKANL